MNEINQFCVRWKHPENDSVITAAIAEMDDGTCEVIDVEHGHLGFMDKIAERAADCEDGSIKVKGKDILPETYCALWRKLSKTPVDAKAIYGKYTIVCHAVRNKWNKDYLTELAKEIGCAMVDNEGEFIRVDMLDPVTDAAIWKSYFCERSILDGKFFVTKVQDGLFAMRAAA